MTGKFISTQEAHELTGYAMTHIRQLATMGKIVTKKFGAALAIDVDSLVAYKLKADAYLVSRGRGNRKASLPPPR